MIWHQPNPAATYGTSPVETTRDGASRAPRLTAGQRAARSADEAAERLAQLQHKAMRAQLFAANAHNKAAQAHERAAAGEVGDVKAHRNAAERHRAARDADYDAARLFTGPTFGKC